MSQNDIRPDEIETFIAARKAGEDYATIAQKLGRSRSTIQSLAERFNLRMRPNTSSAQLSDKLQEQIRRLVEQGHSYTATAKIIGCDPKTVSKIAKQAGLGPTRKFGGSQDMSRTLRARIEAMAGSTATNARLAELLGCTADEVEAVRADRRREAKERARKAYQKRVTMPGYEEDRLGEALKARQPLCAKIPDEEIIREDAAWAAGRKVPSLRELRMAA